jgi:Protein of unknown function (DUF4446)
VDELTTTTGIVAVAACAAALIALLWLIVLARRVSKLRAAQRVVFGDRDARDLVTHAAELDRDFRSLHSYVEDLATGLQSRLTTVEQRLDGAITHHGLIRYDAYNEMSGRQSTSIALLDARGSGVVVSSIHHRDQARLYAKQVVEGRGQLALSPEEQEAIRVALAGEVPDRAEHRR